ncbi:hypothetical protein SAMN05878276_0004 [Aquipseudomonas alcaligenes]|uniref:hypothetical protein n=1 Tax=Aquipseudomonas alcaligenes TaxID=43263 RepID=UPI0009561372|nr:hypothetical protein [Pseudomonas alcaligenes]SIR76815.1 hypothetical protein SAMN05878276_0004 [Pseudomonas alcaligenes]
MNTTDLLAITLRLFALFLLYSAFVMGIQHYQYIHQAAHTGTSDGIGALLVLGILQVGGLLLAAVILLKFPLTLARRLAPAPAAEANSGISAAELQSVAFCVLGVYLLARGLADLLFNATWIIYMLRGTPADQQNLAAYVIQELITVVELCIGLFLCLKADGLSQLIRRLRSAGVP